MDWLLGQIALLPFTFVPPGWDECDGRLLPVNQNAALFELIGTRFGGDGTNSFAVPDLKQQVPCEGLRYCICIDGNVPLRSEAEPIPNAAAAIDAGPEPVPSGQDASLEHEHLRGWLTSTTRYRLLLTGDVGAKEIDNLIAALQAHKHILAPSEGA
jgi:Phage Tail Collar Domain